MEYENIKDWWSSKTVWTAVIAIITAISLGATGEIGWAEVLLGANGVVAILLRFVTDKPIR